jgi:hypothetical protein
MGDDDAVPMYRDVVKGRDRPRKGARKVSGRGSYSGAEKRMKEAFSLMVNVEIHRLDGELSDLICAEMTAWFTLARQILRRYSYQELPHPSMADWEALREEMDYVRREGKIEEGELDVGDLT